MTENACHRFRINGFYRDNDGMLYKVICTNSERSYSSVGQPVGALDYSSLDVKCYTKEGYYGADSLEFEDSNLIPKPVIPTAEEAITYSLNQSELAIAATMQQRDTVLVDISLPEIRKIAELAVQQALGDMSPAADTVAAIEIITNLIQSRLFKLPETDNA